MYNYIFIYIKIFLRIISFKCIDILILKVFMNFDLSYSKNV